jgi:hypothetical protein
LRVLHLCHVVKFPLGMNSVLPRGSQNRGRGDGEDVCRRV